MNEVEWLVFDSEFFFLDTDKWSATALVTLP